MLYSQSNLEILSGSHLGSHFAVIGALPAEARDCGLAEGCIGWSTGHKGHPSQG